MLVSPFAAVALTPMLLSVWLPADASVARKSSRPLLVAVAVLSVLLLPSIPACAVATLLSPLLVAVAVLPCR